MNHHANCENGVVKITRITKYRKLPPFWLHDARLFKTSISFAAVCNFQHSNRAFSIITELSSSSFSSRPLYGFPILQQNQVKSKTQCEEIAIAIEITRLSETVFCDISDFQQIEIVLFLSLSLFPCLWLQDSISMSFWLQMLIQ